MRHSDMEPAPVAPSVRFDKMPHAIQGGNQALFNGWETRPTGYQPDHYGDTMGRIPTPLDNIVVPPYGSPGALGMIPTEPGSSYDKVDQHPMLVVAATWTPGPSWGNGRPDGGHDPLTDGPPRPDVRNISLFYHRAAGSTNTRFQDVPDGRKFSPYGSQDGASTTIYVDSASALRPYEPDPRTGQNPDSMRRMAPSPPHGWSAIPAVTGPEQDMRKTGQLRQQKNVKQNRLANSTYAGQTYSQQTAHVANRSGGNVPSWRPRG